MSVNKPKYYADVKPETGFACRKCDQGTNILAYWYENVGASECTFCHYRIEKRRVGDRIEVFGWYPENQNDKLDLKTDNFSKLDPYNTYKDKN